MNTLLKKITAGLSIILSLGLVACQKDSLVLPELPAPISTQAVNAVNDVIKVAEKYTLTAWGSPIYGM